MGGTVFNGLKGAAASLVAVACLWPLVTHNLSDHFTRQATRGGPGVDPALDRALFWDKANPLALRMRAERLLAQDQHEAARHHLRLALRENPADGLTATLLAGLEAQTGQVSTADGLAEVADRLAPVQPTVQRRLGYYWLGRQQPERGFAHLARSLWGEQRAFEDEVFGLFLRAAESPESRGLLAPYAADPPPWWERFFRYATREAADLDSVRALYAAREASEVRTTTDQEQRWFIERLIREGQMPEAYLAWVNTLAPEELSGLGFVYDGGFELPPANHGFAWVARPPANRGIVITPARTAGMGGQAALRLDFRGDRQRFSHLFQRLFLAPGAYQVSGRVRPQGLEARRGLQWRLACSQGMQGLLGESELFTGEGDWREFSFQVVVPPGCSGQILRLQSAGSRDVDHEVAGTIWFDDLTIEANS